MPQVKIVLIGAAGAGIGLDTICDLVAHRQTLAGANLVLVDVDTSGLAQMHALAQRLSERSGARFSIEATSDRRQALPGADFVVVSVSLDRLPLWQRDWEIPRRLGVRHVMGENSGPGGLSHALRSIPLVLEICRDVEELCPQALLINFTNPLARVCLAITRHTGVRAIGLCHQIGAGYANVAQVLGIHPAELELVAAGINHFTWILSMRRRGSAQDLYPAFRERVAMQPPSYEPLSRRLFDAFGLYPATGDDHLGEDIGFAWETDELATDLSHHREPSVMASQRGVKEYAAAALSEAVQEESALLELLDHRSNERIVPVICAVAENRHQYEVAVNLVNGGAVPNLPPWAVVEMPAIVDRDGVKPVGLGPLPEGCAALLCQRIAIHSLTVTAAVNGDRQAALQALLLDPVVNSYQAAAALLDELLSAHSAYLPAFRM